MSIEERFWPKVKRSDGCWIWTRKLDRRGYGLFATDPGRYRAAHRVAWQLATGEWPGGMEVCHTCDTPACVKNSPPGWHEINGVLLPTRGHLFLGTQAINVADMVMKRRNKTGDDHYLRLMPEKVLRGEKSSSAKLTENDVTNIRSEYACGNTTLASLADHYGIGVSTVWKIVHWQRWKHLTEHHSGSLDS